MSKVVKTWPVASLFDFCNPKQWPTIPQTAFVEQGYPVYGANGKIGHYTEFNHEKPTVLITCRGATCGTINVCEPKSYVTGNAMALDDLDESRVSAEYLVYALRTGSLAQAISGTAQPQITRQSLTAISIPLPPLAEQRRIAEVLDQAEALRAKRRAALAQLDSLIQSLFLDLFGDPVSSVPRYPSQPLEYVLARPFQNGAYFPKEAYCAKGGVEMVHMSDAFYDKVTRGSLKRVACGKADIEKYSVSDSDILVARRSLNYEGAAKPCLIPASDEPLIFESSFIRVTPCPDAVIVLYLYHYLSNERVRRKSVHPLVTQSTISGINQSNLARVPVVVPPIELQREFAHRVTAVEKLKTAQRASLAELDALFASLQHRAFRGEL